MVEVTVAHIGFDQRAHTPVVFLRERAGTRVLPIWIGPFEAQAIVAELKGVKPSRPQTHDLLGQVLRGLGGELKRVLISGVRENTYYAQLLIHRESGFVEVDARPSDSIALALRLDAPIFTAESLLDEPGAESPDLPPGGLDAESLKQHLEKLDPQDFGRFSL